jgi:DNA-binding transcriptional ArsR family regulator
VPIAQRRVVGDAKRWKALSHPLRGEMLRHLDEHGPATSTTIAEALGENTGTTSYHPRVLADAGIIEEVPERAHGRERWWRTFPIDHREPDYDSLAAEDRAVLDEWRTQQIPGELALVDRFVREVRQHGRWAKASRASAYYTVEDLDALFDEYMALLSKYGHTAKDAPPGARPMLLRMFYIPDEPVEATEPVEAAQPGEASEPADAAQSAEAAQPAQAAEPGSPAKRGEPVG